MLVKVSSRVGSAASFAASFMLLAWAMISGPLSIISAIHDLTEWQSLWANPLALWSRQMHELVGPIPIVRTLPDWAIHLSYIALLGATVFAYHWLRVVRESRRLVSIATSGQLSSFQSYDATRSIDEKITSAAPAVGFFGGSMLVNSGAALGALGPVGWGLAAIAGACALGIWLDNRDSRRKEEKERHDAEQTARHERERVHLVSREIAHLRDKESRKLIYASAIVIAVTAISFVVPLLLG